MLPRSIPKYSNIESFIKTKLSLFVGFLSFLLLLTILKLSKFEINNNLLFSGIYFMILSCSIFVLCSLFLLGDTFLKPKKGIKIIIILLLLLL